MSAEQFITDRAVIPPPPLLTPEGVNTQPSPPPVFNVVHMHMRGACVHDATVVHCDASPPVVHVGRQCGACVMPVWCMWVSLRFYKRVADFYE